MDPVKYLRKSINMLGLHKEEKGYALVTVLIMFSLSLIMISGLMRSTSNNIKLQRVVNTNNDRYYNVEDTLGRATGWIQDNSKYFVTLFQNADFSSNFEFSDPTIGENDNDPDQHFNVPTQVKILGTVGAGNGESAIISNNTYFGTSSFPTGVNFDDNTDTKDLVADFQSNFPDAENGGVNLRITILSTIASGSDFSPILRVDAITGNNPDVGTHLYSYVYGAFVNTTTGTGGADDSGFYGGSSVTIGGASWCKSAPWSWDGSKWVRGAYGDNCLIQSQGIIDLFGSGAKIHGAARTNVSSGITDTSKITDNNSGGCAGPGCHSSPLVNFDTYATSCAPIASPPNLTISSNTNLAATGGSNCYVDGSGINHCCWNDVTINNKEQLILTTANDVGVYHFNTLSYGGGHKDTKLQISSSLLETEVVDLHVEEVSGGHINGQQTANLSMAPQQLRFILTGIYSLTLNGTAEMRAHVYAPRAAISLSGNFAFYGKINALSMNSTGTADIYSDEVNTGGPQSSADLNLRVTKVTQRYR